MRLRLGHATSFGATLPTLPESLRAPREDLEHADAIVHAMRRIERARHFFLRYHQVVSVWDITIPDSAGSGVATVTALRGAAERGPRLAAVTVSPHRSWARKIRDPRSRSRHI